MPVPMPDGGCRPMISWYRVKRVLLTPRTLVLRRRMRDAPRLARTMLEEHAYARPMRAFMGAVAANPDLLVDADLDESSVVVDAGAYLGEWSERVVARYGARVYAFEPNPVVHDRLAARFDGDARVSLERYGLGGRDRRERLTLAGPASSVAPGSVPGDQVEVVVRDVAAVLTELGLDHGDLMKVNIEGSEYDLFDRLDDAGWLDRIRLVSVQFHEWFPGAHRRRRHVRRALARTHEEVWCFPWVWEMWRRRS